MKSDTVWMCVFLLLLDEASSWDDPSVLFVPLASEAPGSQRAGSKAGDQPERVDCIQATEMCNQNPSCSSRYRVMRQCLVGKEKEAMLDNNRDCQAALEVLLGSPLYDCRCRRSMKNELQCLQNYWAIHMGLNEGGDMEDSSPYEPVAPNRQPDVSRLASISSGMLTLAPKGFSCPDAEKVCNPCLDATKACNLNNNCKKHRASFISTCTKEDQNKGDNCNKKRCHKSLRSFMDRVPAELSHRLLFCPCQSEGCAERRRQTIVPDCSYKDKEKPNCLELRRVCRQDALCRSRLADFVANCWTTSHPGSTCPNPDNPYACSASYARLIGTEMTPNYVDNSFTNWTISPWCTCKGSGNNEEECINFLRLFTDNTCLRNAIQAFGYGIDIIPGKNVTVPSPLATSPDWTASFTYPSVTFPKNVEQSSGGLARGEARSLYLCANVLALLPSLALALILVQHVL
ncbi:GDNF family receptor alpha-2-like [Kryptolebias marmoratus]|uniref:GDNF family receptor alpha-2 n=1 Tax=Kryptolebias marmoratus TaxID=37003 RepID=A0A3Q2ZZV2_KRYMA|nr:GDNF family receptor alpha-2-like [Kryptolebias marmoratus]